MRWRIWHNKFSKAPDHAIHPTHGGIDTDSAEDVRSRWLPSRSISKIAHQYEVAAYECDHEKLAVG